MTTRPNEFDDSNTSISEHLFATYPLHYVVWLNDYPGLKNALHNELALYRDFLEVKDPHGRTPLQLAVRLYRRKQILLLLRYCNVECIDKYGFNIFHDAFTTQDMELLELLYERVERAEIACNRAVVKRMIANERFVLMNNFYYEIHLDYSSGSLLPFNRMSRDIIRIWKRDNGLRIDSSLVEVDTTSGSEPAFIRGDRTWMYFCGGGESWGQWDFECYSLEPSTLQYGLDKLYNEAQAINAADEVRKSVAQKIRLRRYILEQLTIAEKMQKTGLASFVCAGQEPVQMTEQIGDYFCAVYSVTNYWEVVTKKWDHLAYSHEDLAELNTGRNLEAGLDEAEYFDPESREDIGPPSTMKSNKFPCKAKLWMTQIDRWGQIGRQQLYFTIQEHVLPILGLLLQRFSFLEPLYHILDSGCWLNQPMVPIKAEIPLYSKVRGATPNVTISFANLYGRENPTGLGLTPVVYRDPNTRIKTNGITIGNDVFDIMHNFHRID